MQRGRFVGVGIDAYEALEPLEHAVAEVKAVAEVLQSEFVGEPLLDPDEAQVREYLKAVCSASDLGARDGVFGEELLRLLSDGPRSADMQRRWSKHNRLIRGDDLGQALLEDWTADDQRPDFLRRGRAWYMLPNPLWDPGAPEQVVEHLLLAARGGTGADDRSWFTGRETEVDTVVTWVKAGAAGCGGNPGRHWLGRHREIGSSGAGGVALQPCGAPTSHAGGGCVAAR